MADVDNFDIDIYGDDTGQEEYAENGASTSYNYEDGDTYENTANESSGQAASGNSASNQNKMDVTPANNPPPQGVKRKTMDERPIDPQSTNAIQVTELHWWITEDELRGYCAGAGCEDDLKEITFNEHKVNGKSKG
jgi:hypothetical protein